LFHPADGALRPKGITSCTTAGLQGWLKQELSDILATRPKPVTAPTAEALTAVWTTWTTGLTNYPHLPAEPAEARMLLSLDNLAGHLTPAVVRWLFDHGIIPLYTPLGGSWLYMAESIPRIIERRAREGQHPQRPAEIIVRTPAQWPRASTERHLEKFRLQNSEVAVQERREG